MKSTVRHLLVSLSIVMAAGIVAIGATSCSSKGRKGARLAEANRYFAAGEYEKAEIEYKNVLQAEALNPDAIGRLGQIYFEEGRLRQSIPYLLKARELKPDTLDVRRKLGMLYITFGKLKDAQTEAAFILDHQPTDENAPILLVESSLGSPEEIQAARQRLQQLPGGAADAAPVIVALGIIDFRQRNLDAAEAAFKRAVALDPKFVPAYAALGGLYRVKKDTAGAEQALKTAADLAPIRSGKALQYAQFKIQNGDTEGGRRVLEDVARKAPDYLPAQALLAEMDAAAKKFDESAAIVAKILARDPEHPEAMLLSGRLKLAKGEPDKAVVDLEKMLKAYPNSPQALYFSGLAYSATGDRQKAIDRLTQAVNLAPSTEAIMALASLNLRKGDYSAVIVGLKPLIQQRPDNAAARLMLADAYRGQGNYDDALALYRQSEKDFPRNPQASLMSGMAFLQQKKVVEARAAFEEALRREPGLLPALEQLVYLDVYEKRLNEAKNRVELELVKYPNAAGLHVLLAKVLVVLKENDAAEAELKKGIEIQPEVAEAYYQLAQLYVTTNQQQKALTSLEAVTARNPKDVKALLMIGLIQEHSKNYAAARDAYEKILLVNPKFSPALNNLAYLYSEQFNEPDKAYEAAQKARELLPNEAHVADTLGWVLFKKGQYARALSLLEESAERAPTEGEIQYHLGATRYMLGQEQPAKVALQRALELKGDAPWADDARKRLAVLATDSRAADSSAIAGLEKVIADRPGDPIALGRLAVVYERTGALDKAIATYQSAAKANPGSAAPLMSIARIHAAKKDAVKALEAAKAARKLAPDDLEVAKTLGALAYQVGDYTWAANLLQDAARKQPDDPELLFDTASALYSIGKVPEAESAMRDALHPPGPVKVEAIALGTTADALVKDPSRAAFSRADSAKLFLEMLALAANPTPAGGARINQALQADPDYVPALMALGASQERKPDAGAARQSYEKVLVRFPDFAPAKLRIAVLASTQKEFDSKAYDWAVQARTAFPSDPDAGRALGILMYRKGSDHPRAVTLLKQSLANRASDPEAQYYLGLAQIQTKDTANARQSLQKAIDLGLRADLAGDARKALDGLK